MTGALILVFALPLAVGSLGVLLHGRLVAQRAVSILALLGTLAAAVRLVEGTRGGEVLAVDVGGWPGGLAIVVAVDLFSALMLSIGALMTLVGLLFAITSGEDDHLLFHPLVMFLWTGVALAFVTADLFNLFVAFEVMLIASYVLLTLRGGRDQVRAGVIYVGTNLLASTLFLIGVGIIYGATGTVNLAGVAAAIPTAPGALAGLSVLLIAVAAKASLVPLHGWLPRTYVHASPAVTAIFSALLTKAGVYVLYRLTSTMLAEVDGFLTLALVVASVTMFVGVLGAVGGHDMRGILTFHMVSQVGYLILPLGLWTTAAITAGLFYLLQYVAVKGALFLVAGATIRLEGTDDLDELGGLLGSRRWLAIAFLLPALALAGIPPSSGFLGKFLLVRAAFESSAWWAGGTAVVVSLLTLLSMIKIFNGAFWGERTTSTLLPANQPTPTRTRVMIGLPLGIGVGTLVLGLAAGPLLELAAAAAQGLADPSAFLTAVSR
jgi:multicomponent Na+:H+ antiporter subunit D